MEYLTKLINRLKRKYIPIEDISYLNELLKTDLPIKTSINLIKNSSNETLFNELIDKLDKGYLIEEVISDYLPKQISSYMLNLLKKLSFKESLDLSLSFYNKNKDNSKQLEKAITYPIVLLFISLTGLYLFDTYGLDSVLDLMRSFNSNISSFSALRVFIRIIIYFFYYSFLFLSIVILIFVNPKRIRILYILLSKYFPNSLIKIYFSEEFITLFVICLNFGYKTKEAIEILKSLSNKPLVAFLASHIDDNLMEGKSLIEASSQIYFDDVLKKFVNIASYTKNFCSILNNYSELSKEKIKNKMNLLTIVLQTSSYFVIGMVIVFIYQVLFLPMQAITGL